MPSLGSYLLGAAQLLLLLATLGLSAHGLRRRLLATWSGPPALLVELVLAVALLVGLSELLGILHLLYAGALLALSTLLAVALWRATRGARPLGGAPAERGAGEGTWSLAVMALVIAATAFHWLVITKHALDRGIFNFDSLWYHMPFAAQIAQSHSVTGLEHVETVFTNWFYPQNSELLHAVGILLVGRDTLSLFINLGWLALGFLAAYCVGRPYGRGSLTAVAAAILLECHTLVVRDPGSGKNDLAAAALLLASIAILVEAWSRRGPREGGWERWGLAASGLAAGLAAGTRVTVLAMAAALTVGVVILARGRRRSALGWWLIPALAGGGYWYLRNLLIAGNPIPEVKGIGPIALPHPVRLQEGRPDFSIVHYATDTGVWSHYFAPGLHDAFGALWPLVIAAAAAAALLALFAGRDAVVRVVGGVALFGLIAYLFTPLSAAGAEGEPVGFGINIRYVVPALLAGIVLVPLPRQLDPPPRRGWLLGALVLVFLLTDRPDRALHEKGRIFALAVVLALGLLLLVAVWMRRRGLGKAALAGAGVAVALAAAAVGYPLQRHYLEGRFANAGPREERIPGMGLDAAYRWARGVGGSRIGLVGTTAGFAGYGFFGADLSNTVRYLGREGADGAFNAIPSCAGFRAAVNAAALDYLVTAPFLNFIHPERPIASPESRWLRGEPAVRPILRSGRVTVWRVRGPLHPGGCGPANAPLREVPNTPAR